MISRERVVNKGQFRRQDIEIQIDRDCRDYISWLEFSNWLEDPVLLSLGDRLVGKGSRKVDIPELQTS